MVYRLKDFGSYTVGGRIAQITEGEPFQVQFTRSASHTVDPRGHFAIEHAYVQYFVPESRRPGPPVVLVHGGGMSGACWDTTPDGRPGWLQALLKRGHEVHVVDAVERGRAGFAPGHWDGDPLLRSLEEAWTLFRIGAREGFSARQPFETQLFPFDHLEALARTFVPRWLSTTHLQTRALLAVLERTGPAVVICHSQGGEVAFDAHQKQPDAFESIIALEPSFLPEDPAAFARTDLTIVAGDHLQIDQQWIDRGIAWQNLVEATGGRYIDPTVLGPGNSHMLMMDKNSDLVLEAALAL
jgi:pimeloyl-ACP methyl ester carboxylesterase